LPPPRGGEQSLLAALDITRRALRCIHVKFRMEKENVQARND
jgi:hypothetical protein